MIRVRRISTGEVVLHWFVVVCALAVVGCASPPVVTTEPPPLPESVQGPAIVDDVLDLESEPESRPASVVKSAAPTADGASVVVVPARPEAEDDVAIEDGVSGKPAVPTDVPSVVRRDIPDAHALDQPSGLGGGGFVPEQSVPPSGCDTPSILDENDRTVLEEERVFVLFHLRDRKCGRLSSEQ